MKGCIASSGENEYSLVAQRGSRVRLDSAENLASHVGQQVKISGTFVEPSETAPQSDSSSSKSDKLHPARDFRVLKLDVLSQTCVQGKKK